MLDILLECLSKRKSSAIVFNQYSDKDILNNLKVFFEYLVKSKSKVLLIGEAPGYKGCRLTGIPFTSGIAIKNTRHEALVELIPKIRLNKTIPENTASILWEFLGTNKPIPILWNAFPFHPHKEGILESNRKPNKEELLEGSEYLHMVNEIFRPKKVFALGRVGEVSLRALFPEKEIGYIRHPSYGGKKQFIEGVSKVFNQPSLK